MYEVDKTSGGAVTKVAVYYPVGGAMRINGTLYFILGDHLGFSSVVTDASGTTVGEDRFYPYGETRFTTGTMYTDKLYTGQREMTGLGIYQYGARFYSPKLGRFLSPDTIIPGAANAQAYNRYSYVLGNPLRYTDPTGHMQDEDDDYKCYGCTPPPPTPAPSSTPTQTPSPTSSPTSTPTSSSTPCPVVLLACQSTATGTPIPTQTSTPTTTSTPYTGPLYTTPSPPQPYLDIDIYVDWNDVDIIDALIDGFGLVVDVVTVIPATAAAGAVAQPAASIVEGIGLGKSFVELVQGDPRSMLYDQTMSQGERVLVMLARTERIVPVWGIFGSGVSLWQNLKPQITAEWVTP